jgi:hypothetical protein
VHVLSGLPVQERIVTGQRWTPEEIRDFLAENVTVVAPGETLVIRAQDYMTPRHVHELQEFLNAAREYGSLSFGCLVVPGAEFGKVSAPEPDDGQFAARVAKALGSDAVQNALRRMALRQGSRNPAARR